MANIIQTFPKGSGSGGGAIFSYIDSTKTALDADWLKTVDNKPIVPKYGSLYLILTAGDYYNSLYRFNPTTNKYVLVISDMGGVVFATIDSTKTALDSNWLKNENNNTISPEDGVLYLIITSGDYLHSLYRYNTSTSKYVLVSDGSVCGVVISTINSSGTLLSSNWLKNSNDNVITPKAGYIYLVITDGVYKNNYYRYDFTANKYVLINRPGHYIQNKGQATNFRNNVNMIDFDFEDDSTNDATKVKAHLLTENDILNIMYPMPNPTGDFISNYLVANPYSPEASYLVGDFCFVKDDLYCVIKDKPAGTDVPPPNLTYYVKTSVGSELTTLKNKFVYTDLSNDIVLDTTNVNSYGDIKAYQINNIVMISIQGITFKNTGTLTVLTGLPEPKMYTVAPYIGANGLKTAQVYASGSVAIMDPTDGYGTLKSYIGTLESLWMSMVYLTD